MLGCSDVYHWMGRTADRITFILGIVEIAIPAETESIRAIPVHFGDRPTVIVVRRENDIEGVWIDAIAWTEYVFWFHCLCFFILRNLF